MTNKPVVVGLIGGIGSGKTSVGRLFESSGAAEVIDADKMVHALLEQTSVKKNSGHISVKKSWVKADGR